MNVERISSALAEQMAAFRLWCSVFWFMAVFCSFLFGFGLSVLSASVFFSVFCPFLIIILLEFNGHYSFWNISVKNGYNAVIGCLVSITKP
jgi:hypothetical protein